MHSYQKGDRVVVRLVGGTAWGTVQEVDYQLGLALIRLDDETVHLVGPEDVDR